MIVPILKRLCILLSPILEEVTLSGPTKVGSARKTVYVEIESK